MREGQLLSVLKRTSKLHANATEVRRERHRVTSPALRQLHQGVRRLSQLLEAENTEESLKLIRVLKRFRFLSAATPLPFDHPFVWPPLSAEMLQEAGQVYPILFPDVRDTLASLISAMDDLQQEPLNPIASWLLDTVPSQLPGAQSYLGKSQRYLVLADARAVDPVKTWVNTHHLDLRVAKAGDFNDGETVDEQIFVGSSAWYPEWVFTAPRTCLLRLVQDAWLWDEATFAAHFGYNRSRFEPINFTEVGAAIPSTSIVEPEVEDRIEVDLPHVDWQRIISREQGHGLQGGEEAVAARLHLLQGNAGVWLRVGKDETVLGLELDVDAGHHVERFDIDELQPGDHILLRTQGAGDFLEEMAEAILGEDGTKAHAVHREWKAAVRKQIDRHQFIHRSLRALRNAGATRLSEHNLRSWASDENLRPNSDANFKALVEFAGMLDRYDEISVAVRSLRYARLSAAQRIGHLIRGAVADADVEELRRDGRQNFGLPGGQLGGTLTAYTVIAIAEEGSMIGPSRIGRVFSLQGGDFA